MVLKGVNIREMKQGIEKRNLLFYMLYACLGIVVTAEIIVRARHMYHVYFWWSELPGFYALSGLSCCILLILVAKSLGHWLNREEGYYERVGGAE